MGLKDWGLAPAETAVRLTLQGCYADIQRWEDIYNGGGDWRYARGEAFRQHQKACFTGSGPGAVRGTRQAVFHGGYSNVLLRQRYRELRGPGSH